MRPIIAARLSLGFLMMCANPARGQAATAQQARPEHDLNSYGVVETVAGMDRVRVVRDVAYKTVAGQVLQMDVYYPPGPETQVQPLPAVVFVNGVGDRPGGAKLRTWGQYTSWPRLIAASGMVAVTFDSRPGDENAEDVHDALAYVHAKGTTLGIDASRIGAWACSANVRAALTRIMQPGEPVVRTAVIYYGAGDVTEPRADLPVLLVRAGRDRPQQNEQIDRLSAQALAANAPWTVVNLPNAHHAFDVLDDTDESRIAIRKTVAFLGDRLQPQPPPSRPPSEALEALAHFFTGEWPEAEVAYARYVDRHPDDAIALVRLGTAQVELKKTDEAAASLKKATALDPGNGDAWVMLGRIETDRKDYVAARDALTKAIGLMPDNPEAHFQLGKAQLAQQEVPAAIASLERAVQLNPGNGWAWNSLAYAYLAAREPVKAAGSFERVLAFAPKNPGLLYNTACAYALAGDSAKAVELLDRAVTEGYKDKAGMMADPDLAAVRNHPRFAEIVKRLG
jgi:Flp pilus assembly protein TadD/dienelactone hydrolase